MDNIQISALLEKHVPVAAVGYCQQLWQEHPFHLRLRKPRVSKLGDFCCRPGKVPQITINRDSHPYLFVITYVHEVAHLVVHKTWGWRVDPHGSEWKQTFRELFLPILTTQVFPFDVVTVLEQHMINPKASSFSDVSLSRVIRQYDDRLNQATFLSEIPEGTRFEIRGRWFVKGRKKRTRVICLELENRRNYLIPINAQVVVAPVHN